MSISSEKKDEPVLKVNIVPEKNPIFIMGILPRSGTNFISDLLCLHPECGTPGPIWEDHLVRYTDLLIKYSNRVFWRWRWYANDLNVRLKDLLVQFLGNGLVSFLASQTRAQRIVTKTPSVVNIRQFFNFFPDAHLIIIVRDGRAAVESGVKSFGWKYGWTYEAAMHNWVVAAKAILDFNKSDEKAASKVLIVKYEDLTHDLEPEIRKILAFLGLELDGYDFKAALQLPVRGSSIHRGDGNTSVHWKPIKKSSEFDSALRWRHWSRRLHERFNWIAGSYMKQLGYDNVQETSSRFGWRLWNTLLDIVWPAQSIFWKTLKGFVWRRPIVIKRGLFAQKN